MAEKNEMFYYDDHMYQKFCTVFEYNNNEWLCRNEIARLMQCKDEVSPMEVYAIIKKHKQDLDIIRPGKKMYYRLKKLNKKCEEKNESTTKL